MKKALKVVAGFVCAFIIISLFEFGNSRLYPMPEGLDVMNLEAVKEFSQQLPLTAFLIVLLGWATGTVGSTLLILKLAGTEMQAYINAGILTFMAVLNNFMFLAGVHPLWFNIIGLPLFFVGTYLTLRFVRKESVKQHEEIS